MTNSIEADIVNNAAEDLCQVAINSYNLVNADIEEYATEAGEVACVYLQNEYYCFVIYTKNDIVYELIKLDKEEVLLGSTTNSEHLLGWTVDILNRERSKR